MKKERSMFKRFMATVLSFAVVVFVMSGCQYQPSSSSSTKSPSESHGTNPEIVKIAIFTNLTGTSAADGEYARRAFEIVEEMINDRMGGIQSMGGAKLELVYNDTVSYTHLTLPTNSLV